MLVIGSFINIAKVEMYTLCTIQYTVCTIHYTLYSIHYTLYSIHYTIYTIQYTVYSIHHTLYSIHYTLYSMQYTVYTIQHYKAGSTLFVRHFTRHTLIHHGGVRLNLDRCLKYVILLPEHLISND